MRRQSGARAAGVGESRQPGGRRGEGTGIAQGGKCRESIGARRSDGERAVVLWTGLDTVNGSRGGVAGARERPVAELRPCVAVKTDRGVERGVVPNDAGW